eukprot:12573-Heterococcus_DN1.PRE.2
MQYQHSSDLVECAVRKQAKMSQSCLLIQTCDIPCSSSSLTANCGHIIPELASKCATSVKYHCYQA